MSKKSKLTTMVLVLSLVSIIGVLFTIVSDCILLGKPNNGYDFFKLGTESMATLPYWRITFGTFLGIVALPLQIAGLINIYLGLKPGGKILPFIVLVALAHGSIMAVAFHISYAFIGYSWNLYYKMGDAKLVLQGMMSKFTYCWKLLLIIMIIEVTFSSICYIFLILKRNTLYPKWMALFNPICVILYMYFIALLIPYPLGGYVSPAFLNLATLVFLIFSNCIVYKKLASKESCL